MTGCTLSQYHWCTLSRYHKHRGLKFWIILNHLLVLRTCSDHWATLSCGVHAGQSSQEKGLKATLRFTALQQSECSSYDERWAKFWRKKLEKAYKNVCGRSKMQQESRKVFLWKRMWWCMKWCMKWYEMDCFGRAYEVKCDVILTSCTCVKWSGKWFRKMQTSNFSSQSLRHFFPFSVITFYVMTYGSVWNVMK